MKRRRLKILLSAYACMPDRGSEPGVGWNAAASLARHHDVWVLTQDEGRDEIERALERDPIPGLTVTVFDVPGFLYRRKLDDRFIQLYYPRWQRAVLPVARRLHEQVGFDLVHHITLGKYWQASHLWKLGIPFVLGPVGGGESAPRGFLSGYDSRGRLYEHLRDVARWQGERSRAVREMIADADACLTATAESAKRLDKAGARKTIVMPGQTALGDDDLAYFDSLEAQVPERPRFVAASRLIHWKGLHLAVAALARSGMGGARLEVIGDGPERRRLERLAERLGVKSAVHFHGELSRPESLRVMAGCTALIHPALHDFSPTVVFEAMGLGLPVVALSLNGPAVQVTPETGVLIPARDPDTAVTELADAMVRLATDRSLRDRLGAAAYRRVRDQYTWQTKAALFDEVYREVLGIPLKVDATEVPA